MDRITRAWLTSENRTEKIILSRNNVNINEFNVLYGDIDDWENTEVMIELSNGETRNYIIISSDKSDFAPKSDMTPNNKYKLKLVNNA